MILVLCDKNCFSCKWDDCINDEITQQDLDELEAMDRELFPEDEKVQKIREYKRAWNAKNKERNAAMKRKWRLEKRREKRG